MKGYVEPGKFQQQLLQVAGQPASVSGRRRAISRQARRPPRGRPWHRHSTWRRDHDTHGRRLGPPTTRPSPDSPGPSGSTGCSVPRACGGRCRTPGTPGHSPLLMATGLSYDGGFIGSDWGPVAPAQETRRMLKEDVGRWTATEAAELFEVGRWGKGYFSVGTTATCGSIRIAIRRPVSI